MVYEFETAKLLDFSVEQLEASDNPAAMILLSHHFTKGSRASSRAASSACKKASESASSKTNSLAPIRVPNVCCARS